MPGPTPTPSPRRRNARPGVVQLPAAGYDGPMPPWPLPEGASEPEWDAWTTLWRRPQAAAWAQMHLERVVARYVRTMLAAEQPGAYSAVLGEARQMEDRLGLSPMSMLRLRWEVVADELDIQRTERGSARPRLVAVDPKAASSG